MNSVEKINLLKKEIESIKKNQLEALVQNVKSAESMGLPQLVSSSMLQELQTKGQLRLWGDQAQGLYNFLQGQQISCALCTVYREVDPYSYWPGDEISGYKDVVLT